MWRLSKKGIRIDAVWNSTSLVGFCSCLLNLTKMSKRTSIPATTDLVMILVPTVKRRFSVFPDFFQNLQGCNNNNRDYAQTLAVFVNNQPEVFYHFGTDLIAHYRSGEPRFYHTDALGSTRVLTDSSGDSSDEYATKHLVI